MRGFRHLLGAYHTSLRLFPLLTLCVIPKGTSEAIIRVQPQRLLLRLEKPCENRELGIMREARAPFPLLCCRAPHCALMEGGEHEQDERAEQRAAGDAVLSPRRSGRFVPKTLFIYGGRVTGTVFSSRQPHPRKGESGTLTRN